MANLLLKFTNKNNKLCLCATVQGTAIRHYKVVEGLKNPNFSKWDNVAQQFISKAKDAKFNNEVLTKTMERYRSILQSNTFSNGSELFAYAGPIVQAAMAVQEPKEITLGEWIEKIIEEIRNPSRLKPSSSYQAYLTLFHALEKEGKLINMPISTLNDDSFVHFINWIKKKKEKRGKGNNFIGLMKIFRATLSRAKKARLTTYTPDFPYMDYAPIFHKISEKATEVIANGGTVQSLTPDQMQQFKDMDESTVKMGGGAKMEYFKTLYKDFAILLYELKSRPYDIVKLHWDNIAVDPATGRYALTYIPAKKKNYGKSARHTSSPLVVQYLTKEAVRIILKYKGKSKGGYVFPFGLNEKKYNQDDPQDYHYYYYNANHICGRVNRFLHAVGQKLGTPFKLTLYAFRRSAITHAIMDNKIPVVVLAKMAGTSVEMIERHYANYLHTLSAYPVV